jgi:adhesin transport system outer membrane protein
MLRLGSTLLGFAAGFAILAGIGVSEASATSLQESIAKAVSTHPRVGALQSNRLAIDKEVRQARGLYLPQVDLRAGIGIEYSDSPGTRSRGLNGHTDSRQESSIILQERIFDGFEADSEVERQLARSKSASHRIMEASENTALQAAEAHIEVLRFRKLVDISEQNVATHRVYLERVTQRATSGAGTADEIAQAQSRLEQALAALAETQNGLRDAEALYIQTVGDAPEQLDEVPFPGNLPADLDNALKLSTKNARVQLTSADVEVTQAELTQAESRFYPKINLELSARNDDDLDGIEGKDADAIAMVVLRWNLYRGGIDTANRGEAIERIGEARSNRLVAFRDFDEEMRKSWASMEQQTKRAELLRNAVAQNVVVRDAYSQQFDLGTRSLLDLLDSEAELYGTMGRQITAEHARVFAAYRVLAVSGELQQNSGVAPPKEATPSDRGFYDTLME